MSFKHFIQITKPGIIFGNVLSVAGGFSWPERACRSGHFPGRHDRHVPVVASGCVFNNCIDRDIDLKMERTKNRVLVRA
jgi:protoheme IX farnesyltransferase